ncbi:MAG TPA: alpha/beta fold hydrolase [Candidatus Saccharimonadales bacterium]|nr:alpha/beta fold hydrolase [Candidatus Saccharimonadales bacterium]
MRAPFVSVVLLVLLALGTALAGEAAPPEAQPPGGKAAGEIAEPAVPSPESRARSFVSHLAAGEFDLAAGQYDETMAAVLPAGKLEATWKAVQAKAGSFEAIEETRIEEVHGYDVVHVTCRFGNSPLDVKVVYDAKLRVAGLFFAPAGPPPKASVPSYADPGSYEEKDVTVGSGEWALPGTLTLPREGRPCPALVLVHGSGPLDRDETIGPNKPFRDLAWGLASRGIAVLRYDKRTFTYRERLTGAKEPITVKEETIDDALSAVAALRKVPEIDPSRIFLAGHSLGGMLVPRIAGRDDGIAGFVVLAGGARPLERMMVEQTRYIAALAGGISSAEAEAIRKMEEGAARIERLDPATADGSEPILGAPAAYWLDLKGYDPPAEARSILRPLLILQGGRDYQVTAKDFDLWQKALGSRPNVTLHLFPDLNHLFIPGEGPSTPGEYQKPGNVSPEVIDRMAGWILAQVPRATAAARR